MNILFVNACVRGELSNTRKLCQAALDALLEKYPQATVTEVNLNRDRPQPLHPEEVEERSALRAAKAFDHPLHAYARAFAAADKIVIGAPYWDLSFPSVLKIYLERVCAVDVTFAYPPEGGVFRGLCQADQLLYISTAGGPVGDYNLGFDQIKALCDVFFGIPQAHCFMLDGLEQKADIPAAIQAGEAALRTWVSESC